MACKEMPKLAVWKFPSCDGCQLSLLDCEDELLSVAGEVEIAYFPEAMRAKRNFNAGVGLSPEVAEAMQEVVEQMRHEVQDYFAD